MLHLLSVTTLTCYAVALMLLLAQVFFRALPKGVAKTSQVLFVIGYVAQVALAVPFLFQQEYRFLYNGADYLFWVALAVSSAYLIFRQRVQYPILGVFLLAAVLLFMGSSSYLVHTAPRSQFDTGVGVLLGLHVLPAMLAEACLCIACALSAVFLVQERRLKSKSLQDMSFRGPSLEWLSRTSQRLLSLGFIAMSVALISGVVSAAIAGVSILRFDISVLVATVAWLSLAWIQYGRLISQWSARRMSAATLLSALSIIVVFICMRLFFGTVLHGNPAI